MSLHMNNLQYNLSFIVKVSFIVKESLHNQSSLSCPYPSCPVRTPWISFDSSFQMVQCNNMIIVSLSSESVMFFAEIN